MNAFRHLFEKKPLTINTRYQPKKLVETENNQWKPNGSIDFEPMNYETAINREVKLKIWAEDLLSKEKEIEQERLKSIEENPRLKEIYDKHHKTDAPATDAPATDAPATDAPATDTPASDTPASDTPATDTKSIFGNYKPSGEMQNVYNAIDQLNIDETLKNQLKIQYMREDIIRKEQQDREDNAYTRSTKDAWRAGINPNLINLQPASSSASTQNAQGINASMYATQSNEVIQKAAQEIAYYQAQINAGKLSVEQAKQELEEQKFIANTNRQMTKDEREWTLAWVNIALNMIDTFV